MPHHLPDIDAQIQRALSHPGRTEILAYLMQKRDGTGATAGELAAAFGMDINVVEYHLRVLRDTGLIARQEDEHEPRGVGCFYVAAPSR